MARLANGNVHNFNKVDPKLAARFGARMVRARRAKGITQARLSKLTGIDTTSLSPLENGKKFPSYQTLRVLCSALGVSGDYLLCRLGR